MCRGLPLVHLLKGRTVFGCWFELLVRFVGRACGMHSSIESMYVIERSRTKDLFRRFERLEEVKAEHEQDGIGLLYLSRGLGSGRASWSTTSTYLRKQHPDRASIYYAKFGNCSLYFSVRCRRREDYGVFLLDLGRVGAIMMTSMWSAWFTYLPLSILSYLAQRVLIHYWTTAILELLFQDLYRSSVFGKGPDHVSYSGWDMRRPAHSENKSKTRQINDQHKGAD